MVSSRPTTDSRVQILEQELFESDRWASGTLKDMHNERVFRQQRERELEDALRALAEAKRKVNSELKNTRRRLARSNRALKRLRSSLSWRITRPLRALRSIFKNRTP